MPIAASIIPFWFGIGNHRAFIINFPINVILGKEFISIYKPQMYRLISVQPKLVENYLQKAENLFIEYKIEEKLENLKKSWTNLPEEDRKSILN